MPSANLAVHDYQFAWQTPKGTWRWTTRIDVSKASPSYEVRDLISPYGILRDSIPIPGDVIEQMAASIVQVRTTFSPRILLGASSLSFTVDEGRGVSSTQSLQISNSGVYGSLLATTLTSSAAYLLTTPAALTGIASGASATTEVKIDSTTLTSGSSPYSATITVQDPAATNTPQTVNVTVTVRPKATILVVPDDLSFSVAGPPGGPWPTVPSQTFTITNSGPSGSVLNFQVQKLTGLSDWISSVSPTFGTLNSGAGLNVTVNVAPTPNMLPGIYTETLRISGYSTNTFQDVLVSLALV